MWEKVKEFFNNKIVKIVCWCMLFVIVVGLVIGGATEADVNNGVKLIMGVIGAISLFIVFIGEKIKK